jgi:transposase-like protein
MPAPKDPEFRRRAVELARLREKPIAQIVRDLGIAESGLRRWMAQADASLGNGVSPLPAPDPRLSVLSNLSGAPPPHVARGSFNVCDDSKR